MQVCAICRVELTDDEFRIDIENAHDAAHILLVMTTCYRCARTAADNIRQQAKP